jgi:putative hemolysin
MSGWLWILLAALLGSAYFAGSETAIVTAGLLRQRRERERGKRMASLAERLYRHPEQTLSVLLIGNNMMAVLASISGLMITELSLTGMGLKLSPVASDMVSSLWVAVLVLLFGEVLPKTIAHSYALRLSRLSAPLLLLFGALFVPLHWLLDHGVQLLRRLFGRGRGGEKGISWETVRLHLEASRAAGALGIEEEVVIRRIGLLGRLNVESMLVPLDALPCFPVTGSLRELRERFASSGEVRIFITSRDSDRLLGVIPARRLLCLDDDLPLERLLSPLFELPREALLLDLIDALQPRGRKFAMVVGAGGATLGVIFLEEIIRQLLPRTGSVPSIEIPDPGV